jgi:hypothetical protein
MTESMCPSLHRLGMLLQAAYRNKEKHLASNLDLRAMAKAELDVRRVHNLITQHRSFCRICRFNDAPKAIPQRYTDSRSNVTPIGRVQH